MDQYTTNNDQNLRTKIIEENLAYMREHFGEMTEWEKGWYTQIYHFPMSAWQRSTKMFNLAQRIVMRLKREGK